MIIPVSQNIFGKIQLCPDKPLRPWELTEIVNYCLVILRGLDLAVFPHSGPEVRDVIDGPLVQIFVGFELRTVLLVDMRHEAGHVGIFDMLLRRFPQWFFHDDTPPYRTFKLIIQSTISLIALIVLLSTL